MTEGAAADDVVFDVGADQQQILQQEQQQQQSAQNILQQAKFLLSRHQGQLLQQPQPFQQPQLLQQAPILQQPQVLQQLIHLYMADNETVEIMPQQVVTQPVVSRQLLSIPQEGIASSFGTQYVTQGQTTQDK